MADIVVTATGGHDAVTFEHMKPMKNEAILERTRLRRQLCEARPVW